jgi:hypothetical protein
VGLTGLAAIGALLDHGRPGLRQAATLAGTAVAMVVAAALTPNGPRLLLSPFHVREYAKFVSEWQPPSVHSIWGFGFYVLLALLIVGVARRREPVPPSQLLVICAAIFLGLSYVRTLAPAAVLLVPHVAALWQPASGRAVDAGKRSDRGMHRLGVAVALCALVGTVAALALSPREQPGMPRPAAARVTATAPEPVVITEYGLGGWLLWNAPTVRPAIDGRAEIYPVDYVRDYLSALRMGQGWQDVVDRVRADAALLSVETPLVGGLRDQLHWREVYRDDDFVVLVPPVTVGAPSP